MIEDSGYNLETRVALDPAIENYFINYGEETSIEAYAKKYGSEIAENYEAGKVLIFENIDPGNWDYEFLREVEYPRGRELAKMTALSILEPLGDPPRKQRFFSKPKPHHLLWDVFDNKEDALKYQRIVKQISGDIITIARQLFPTYRILKSKITWRFSETGGQDLHLDSYGKRDEEWRLRMFFNMDYIPRIWNTSYPLDTLVKKYYKSLGFGEHSDVHADDFIRRASKALFGGPQKPGRDKFPHHCVKVAPKTMWLAQSQLIPHQIIYGRRMIAATIHVDPDSMLDPTKNFANRIAQYHEKYNH